VYKHYSTPSLFKALPIGAYVYPARQEPQAIVFALKGLYGMHNPKRDDSWERELINTRNKTCTFVCINTARLSVTDQTSKDAFVGKTFMEECDDIERMFEHLIKEGVIATSLPIVFIAHSFGGTTLLGTPRVLKRASALIMAASGCGKSPTTDKPLLQSLATEEALLAPLRAYEGVYMYIRGTKDSVVPKDSQDKIINASVSAKTRIVTDVYNAEHNLTSNDSDKTLPRSTILTSSLDMVLLLVS